MTLGAIFIVALVILVFMRWDKGSGPGDNTSITLKEDDPDAEDIWNELHNS
jgi:hypothetical protein